MNLVQVTADREVRRRVYLNDHLAAAVGGIRLAKRCRKSNQDTPLGEFLDGFIGELEEDAASLRGLIRALGMWVATPKQLLVAVFELAGRAKLNGQLLGYSPVSRLVELEGLSAGVEAKRSLWQGLKRVRAGEPALEALDLDALEARAERQRDALESHRLRAAQDALA